MAHFRELARRFGAYALSRRIRRAQIGIRRFQRFELAHQPVVFGVGNRRFVEDVIAMVGVVDLRAQLGGDMLYIGGCGLAHRGVHFTMPEV